MKNHNDKHERKRKSSLPVSLSHPDALKDLPDNPDLIKKPKNMLFGEFIKRRNR